ncbi:hypothetical protein N9F27_04030 [Crocinitomicaceae bacterium]|nr:hypothetical protein [Crocinitomicaceae bacterium]
MFRLILIGFVLLMFQAIGSTKITKQRLDSLVDAIEEERTVNQDKAKKNLNEIEDSFEKENRNDRRQIRNILTPGTNPHGEFEKPFSSSNYMNPILGSIITVSFLIFGFYIFLKVRKSIKKGDEIYF